MCHVASMQESADNRDNRIETYDMNIVISDDQSIEPRIYRRLV